MIALLDFCEYLFRLAQLPPRWAQIQCYFRSKLIVTKNILLKQFQCVSCDCLVIK